MLLKRICLIALCVVASILLLALLFWLAGFDFDRRGPEFAFFGGTGSLCGLLCGFGANDILKDLEQEHRDHLDRINEELEQDSTAGGDN